MMSRQLYFLQKHTHRIQIIQLSLHAEQLLLSTPKFLYAKAPTQHMKPDMIFFSISLLNTCKIRRQIATFKAKAQSTSL